MTTMRDTNNWAEELKNATSLDIKSDKEKRLNKIKNYLDKLHSLDLFRDRFFTENNIPISDVLEVLPNNKTIKALDFTDLLYSMQIASNVQLEQTLCHIAVNFQINTAVKIMILDFKSNKPIDLYMFTEFCPQSSLTRLSMRNWQFKNVKAVIDLMRALPPKTELDICSSNLDKLPGDLTQLKKYYDEKRLIVDFNVADKLEHATPSSNQPESKPIQQFLPPKHPVTRTTTENKSTISNNLSEEADSASSVIHFGRRAGLSLNHNSQFKPPRTVKFAFADPKVQPTIGKLTRRG